MEFNYFLVGGAVRDKLLGIEAKDRDFVVTGSSINEMLNLGFDQVGADFPVFLHPDTKEEYALARRDRKVGAGYGGFDFDIDNVSLEDDLARRDLTINSMAIDTITGLLIDPWSGQDDLKCKILRHTSSAFAEDPLRVIRLARFYARYKKRGFIVAPETMDLCSSMIDNFQLDELSDERFWLELEKVLSNDNPECFFELLFELGALSKVNFFKCLFGAVRGANLSLILCCAKAVKERNLGAAHGVDIFVAMTTQMASPFFHTSRAGNLSRVLNHLIDLPRDWAVAAPQIERFFTLIRAWNDQAGVVDDLFMILDICEDLNFPLFTTVPKSILEECLKAGRTVDSKDFIHLRGAEIGHAISLARTDAIFRIF